MTPIQKVLEKFPTAERSREGWRSCCPAHDDLHPSLSIAEGTDGRILLNCHAGCRAEEICRSVGLSMQDLFPPSTSTKPNDSLEKKEFRRRNRSPSGQPGGLTLQEVRSKLTRSIGVTPTASWSYFTVSGKEEMQVLRFDPPEGKTFRPIHDCGKGWKIGAPDGLLPLYQLPELVNDPRVYVTEGEKAADAARTIGLVATTSAHGAKSPHKSDWSALAGKEVVLLPDNDEPGWGYVDKVSEILSGLKPPPKIKTLELPDLPAHGDIWDWLEQRDAHDPDELKQTIDGLVDQVQALNIVSQEPQPAYQPFPVDVLPGPLKEFTTMGAASMACDPAYLALPLLSALGASIGNSRRLRIKRGWDVPPIIWSVLIGESGTTKTPAFKLVMRSFYARQGEHLKQYAEDSKQHQIDLSKWEKEMAAWKRDKSLDSEPPEKPSAPQAQRFLVSDTTVEALAPMFLQNPRGLMLSRDELSGWLGSFDRYSAGAGGDAAHWLSMFNAEPLIVDRKTGIPRTIFVPRASICISGGIQPGPFNRALGVEHRESGLAARLLLGSPPRQPKHWTDDDIDPFVEGDLKLIIDRLFSLEMLVGEDEEPRPVVIDMDDDARNVWIEFYNSHAQEMAELSGDLAAAWSKLEEYAARLALVIHYSRWASDDPNLDPETLDEESMRAGIELVQWFKNEAKRIYLMLGESEDSQFLREVVEWIHRKGGRITPRELQQGQRKIKTADQARELLKQLIDSGYGNWAPKLPGNRGGRPTEQFILNL